MRSERGLHVEETEVLIGIKMLASLVRNEVSWGEACMVWGSLPKFKALMQILACNSVFKTRPNAVKYLYKHKTCVT